MVSSSSRIPRAAFAAYFSRGKRHHGQYMTVVINPSDHLQVSVVVSKKVAKKAVDRNRLRRRAYGVVERYARITPLPIACIIQYKPGALAVSRQVLALELSSLLAQISKPG
jgi:ribonuclease P protein component